MKREAPVDGRHTKEMKQQLERHRIMLYQVEAEAAELRKLIRGLEIALQVATNEPISRPVDGSHRNRDWWQLVRPDYSHLTGMEALGLLIKRFPKGTQGGAITELLFDLDNLSPHEVRQVKASTLNRLREGAIAGKWLKLRKGVYAPHPVKQLQAATLNRPVSQGAVEDLWKYLDSKS